MEHVLVKSKKNIAFVPKWSYNLFVPKRYMKGGK